MSDDRCPFGCDEPWPHENGCVFYLSPEAFAAVEAMIANPPEPTPAMIEAMRLHRELVEKAPERQEASVQKWLSSPEFKASLHQFSQSKIHNIRLAIEAAEAALRVLRRTLAEEEGK